MDASPVSHWYDATVTVRVYLHAPPDADTPERVEDELLSLLDGVQTASALLSVHETDLGDPRDDSALHRPAGAP